MRPDENPFRASQLDALGFVGEDSMEGVMARLEGLGLRGAIVGAKGNGKTTLLRALAGALEGAGRGVLLVDFREPAKAYAAMNLLGKEERKRTVCLIDGLPEMGWLQWSGFKKQLKHFSGVVITSHWAGRLPVLQECKSKFTVLEVLLERLCGEEAEHYREPARRFFSEESGNLHQVFLRLYDAAGGRGAGAKGG